MLVWNAIVKNESKVIDRALNSLLPHVDAGIVVDTGSDDDTRTKILDAFYRARKPIEIVQAPFKNFSQARNEALRVARANSFQWDWLLLADADMELRIDKPDWLNGQHNGKSYDMRQTGGVTTYLNRRLLHRSSDAVYRGVTHEFLDVCSDGVIDGADFLDHADGANRADKLNRDIALLEDALQTEKSVGLIERYHFYLGQSYFEKGNFDKAREYYYKRVLLGGSREECWLAQRQLALCHAELGSVEAFIWEALRAYEIRPQRAEILYDLASFFRKRGENYSSLLFSEAGLPLQRPEGENLFVNNWVYDKGFKEEYGICAYYDKARRAKGASIVDKLALQGSDQARANNFWYLDPLNKGVPSFKPESILFETEDGWAATNPSVISDGNIFAFLVRTVNYTITEDGQYRIRAEDGSINAANPIRTRNFLNGREIMPPLNMPKPPAFPLVIGFEDSRLFCWHGQLWTLSTVRETNIQGHAQQVVAPLVSDIYGLRYDDSWRVVKPDPVLDPPDHQKNWMPWVTSDGKLRFVYRLGQILDEAGQLIERVPPPFDVSRISGGSQVIEINHDTHLCLVHEAHTVPGGSNRYYQHRFVDMNRTGRVRGISAPFYFHDRQIEFVAGLTYIPGTQQLMVSYGARDCKAWTGRMDLDDVLRFIYRDARDM